MASKNGIAVVFFLPRGASSTLIFFPWMAVLFAWVSQLWAASSPSLVEYLRMAVPFVSEVSAFLCRSISI